ncbi:hypothetical protein PG999_001506 [Apiospora kogelbergensis]|uniref:Uncharacterized protein n=1 Tax=Apiospora kogelbergensis TaxID=1337665 RepID=A0AAW0R5Q3_9PEZI
MDRIIDMRSEWTEEEQGRWDKIMEERGLANDAVAQGSRLAMAIRNVSHILYHTSKTRQPIYISAKWFWFKVHKYAWIYTFPRAERKQQDTAFNRLWDADNLLRAGAWVQLGGGPEELASYHYVDYFFRQQDAETGNEPMPKPRLDAKDEEDKENMARNWPAELNQVIPFWPTWPSEAQLAQANQAMLPDIPRLPGCGYFEMVAPPMESWAQCLGNDWNEVGNTLYRASEILGGRYGRDADIVFPIQLRMDIRERDEMGKWNCTLKLGWDVAWLNSNAAHGRFLIKLAWDIMNEYMAFEGYNDNCDSGTLDNAGQERIRGFASYVQAFMTRQSRWPTADRALVLHNLDKCRERIQEARSMRALPVQLLQQCSQVHRDLLQKRLENLSREYVQGLLRRKTTAQSLEARKDTLLEWVSSGTVIQHSFFHAKGLRLARFMWAAPFIQALVVDTVKILTEKDDLSVTIIGWKEMVMSPEGTD